MLGQLSLLVLSTFVCVNFDGKSVMSIVFCDVIMVSLLCVYAKRTGWMIRPRS